MKEHENTRTGLQRAVDLAYAARAARRILQGAACTVPLPSRSKRRLRFL